MGRCWKNLAERKEEEVLVKYKVEESKRGRSAPLEWTEVRKDKKYRIMWGEDCWARIFVFVQRNNWQRLHSKQDVSTEVAEMKQQRRMKIMRDLTRKIRSKGRMDAESRWWVTELLAADCEKAWIHAGWEDTVQKWYKWLEEM